MKRHPARSLLVQLWSDLQWPLLGALWLAALALGVAGFQAWGRRHDLAYSFWDALYLTLGLISLNSGAVAPPLPWQLGLARFLIPALTALSALKAFAAVFQHQAQLVRLQWARGHVIICGLSHKGFHLAQSFRLQGGRVVVIEEDEDNDWIEQTRDQGAIVLVGDATDPALLQRAGVQRARALIAVCDNDGVNAEVAVRARLLVQDRDGEPLLCLVHLVSTRLCELLREVETDLEKAPFRLELFNVFERGARLLLASNPDLDPNLPPPARPPHILLIGMGRMGENVVVEAARAWWNRGRQAGQAGMPPLRLDVIDLRADKKIELLQVRFPRLADACTLTARQMDVRAAEFMRGEFLFDAAGQCPYNAIYICMDDDTLNLQAGLALLRRLPSPPPIVMRMAEEGGLASLLGAGNGNRLSASLAAFPLFQRTCTPDLLLSTPLEILAQTIYAEEARRLRRVEPAARPPRWEALPEELRRAQIGRVERIGRALKSINASLAPLTDWEAPSRQFTPDQVACMSHRLTEDESPAALEQARCQAQEIPYWLALAGYQVILNNGSSESPTAFLQEAKPDVHPQSSP